MSKLIGILLNFFGVGGTLSSFFLWMAKKLTSKALIVPLQYVVTTALVVARVGFVTTMLTLLASIYNKINDVLNQIPSMTAQSSNQSLSIGYNLLQSIGLIDALNDAFALFSAFFIPLMILFVSKLVLSILKMASDEFFKIGMQLQA